MLFARSRAIEQDILKQAKRALRTQILRARDALAPAQRSAYSTTIGKRLIAMQAYRQANVVAAYCSFGSEFDSTALLAPALAAGKRLVLPRIDKVSNRLVFHAVRDLDQELVPGVWGIREPSPERCRAVAIEEIEFMLVPGVAFTARGERLGYGGGYYDAVLSRLTSACHTVSGAFSMQVVDALPTGPFDRRVGAVVTEEKIHGERANN
jgi:5-formyltetrahydrofolate cyclo-ligase